MFRREAYRVCRWGGVAAGAFAFALFSHSAASRDPVANPPPPRTIQQNFCSNSLPVGTSGALMQYRGKFVSPGMEPASEPGAGNLSAFPRKCMSASRAPYGSTPVRNALSNVASISFSPPRHAGVRQSSLVRNSKSRVGSLVCDVTTHS